MRIQKQKQAKWMKKLLVLVLVLTFFLISRGVPAFSFASRHYGRPIWRYYEFESRLARQIYFLTRDENPRLHWNYCLAHVAAIRARRIVATGYFGHRDPVTGINPAWSMIRDECFQFRTAGENFVRGSYNPSVLNRTLMDSPPHRENIMDPSYKLVGIACCDDTCVEEFASRWKTVRSGRCGPVRRGRTRPSY